MKASWTWEKEQEYISEDECIVLFNTESKLQQPMSYKAVQLLNQHETLGVILDYSNGWLLQIDNAHYFTIVHEYYELFHIYNYTSNLIES